MSRNQYYNMEPSNIKMTFICKKCWDIIKVKEWNQLQFMRIDGKVLCICEVCKEKYGKDYIK